MSWRFRKSVKIAPGVRVNVSKRGVSGTIGGRGASLNVGKRGVRTTVGVPGSGVSHSTFHPYRATAGVEPPKVVMGTFGSIVSFVLVVIAVVTAMGVVERLLGIA